MYAVELARRAFELPFTVFIERDRCSLAALLRNHINLNIPQRNVINRFKLALDLQSSVRRTPRKTREKIIVATTHRGRRIAKLYQPLHVQQRRHVRGATDRVRRSVEPTLQLFAVQGQGVRKAVEFPLDTVDVLHQPTARHEVKRKIGSIMSNPSRRKWARETLRGISPERSQESRVWL
ncbi:hypothetical protein PS676_02325 [Pseudomonas fluorescens]|nr:hypothetical protein PS676_02325 [Pseudomonas fluorescens]